MNRLFFLALCSAMASTGCLSVPFKDAAAVDPISSETQSSPAEAVAKASSSQTQAIPAQERDLRWSDLTRLAREHQSRGELDEAQRRLDQAAILTSGLRPAHAARRAVFGSRARLAERLAEAGETQRADLLADLLLDEAEAEPALGNAALVSLARSVAKRRSMEARPSTPGEAADAAPERNSQTRVLSIALRVARSQRASRERLSLAFDVSHEAYWDGDLEAARNAIDLAIADLQIVAPRGTADLASLELHRARIAMAQHDLAQAIADATDAKRIFEENEASSAQLGRSEAVLARALAVQGDTDRAIEMARSSYARLSGDEPIDAYSQRWIVSALARAEAAIGNKGQARRYYDEALEIPVQDFEADRDFVTRLRLEREAIMSQSTSSPAAQP